MKKQVFLLFTAMLFSLAAFAQNNYSFSAVAPSGQILFYLNNGDGTVSVVAPTSNWSGYEKPTGNLIIPDIVENYGVYNVTSIGNLAFSGCTGLTSVTIPNSVTQIGSHAFNNCTGLTSVTIGNSVTSIGADAFSLCHGLTSVNYTGTVDQWHSINFDYGVLFGTNPIAFSHNLYLNNVLLTDLVFSDTTTNINDNFSFDTALTTITIPNSVTRIGDLAFYSCTGLTSVTIPNSVTQIGGGAFCECTGLTSVTIPNSVTQIEGSTFYGCTGLTSVTIPNSVTQIGSAAFSGCTGLISVTIPNSVTSIGDEAFNGCTGLTSVTIPNSVDSIGNHAFFGCTGLTSVTIGNSVTSIGYCAFSFCSGLTSVTIPNSVTHIGGHAFLNCTGLTSVNYTGTVDQWHSINFVFGFETNPIEYSRNLYLNNVLLTDLIFSDTTTNINDNFSSDTALTTITIPNSVTQIGSAAFSGCTGLISVTIPNSVTQIGGYAFSHCTGLTSVTIPNSVDSIGNQAFFSCTGLTSMRFLCQMPPQLGSFVFEDVPTDIPVFIPCGTRTYYVAQLPYFTNYIEQPYEFSAETADESTGTVQVLTAPSCTDHNAVLSAMPANGYRFDHWSTGSTDNPYTMTVTSDTTIIAYFVSNGGGTEGIGEVGENDIHISVFNGRISVEGITNEEVRVYDITGRTVQNRSLPSGVYIVKVGTLPAQKVVVMR